MSDRWSWGTGVPARVPSKSTMISLPSTSKTRDAATPSEMPPDLSLRLFREGATFVLLDVPVGTEIGIDMGTWNTGEKFRGIKMIPPGLHFIYFSAVSKDLQNTAPRTGFFHFYGKKELVVKKYDRRQEDLCKDGVSDEDHRRMKDGLEELDKHLGPYPYNTWRTWVSLTNRITAENLQRLSPPSGRILSAPELSLDVDQSQPPSSSKRMSKLEAAENALPRMTENLESKIRYTNIPVANYPNGATPQEVSKYQLDRSWKLEKAFELVGKPSDYLAELQFAFVAFLVGQHYESFEHWKSLIQLICYSDEAILKYPSLYIDFISDLYFQIKEIPQDFFVDIVASNNFLFTCMQRLINNVNDHKEVDHKLRTKIERFSAFLTSKFDFDFEEEFDDAPTIVNEDEAIVSTERAKLKPHNENADENMDQEFEDDLELEAMDVLGDIPRF